MPHRKGTMMEMSDDDEPLSVLEKKRVSENIKIKFKDEEDVVTTSNKAQAVEAEQKNTNKDDNVGEMEPAPEVEPEPKPEVAGVAAELEEDNNNQNENAVPEPEVEVRRELSPEEGPEPLNCINVNPVVIPEPKDEDCVSSTIDDSELNKKRTVRNSITPDANAVKHVDAIFNCSLREMLERSSNVLLDINRRGHEMLQSLNERMPAPQVNPNPQLGTVQRPKRLCTETVTKK